MKRKSKQSHDRVAMMRDRGIEQPELLYEDDKSRAQIGYYLTYANDTWLQNRDNLKRWNENLAWQWYESH